MRGRGDRACPTSMSETCGERGGGGRYLQNADKGDHPHCVERGLGPLIDCAEDIAVRQSIVARNGVERSGGRLDGGLHDGKCRETHEDPEDQGACTKKCVSEGYKTNRERTRTGLADTEIHDLEEGHS